VSDLNNIISNLNNLTESELLSLNSHLVAQLKLIRSADISRKRGLFSAGDKVSFNGRRGYTEGTIVRVKRKKAIVAVPATGGSELSRAMTGTINWDVPLNMLSAA